jgi:hypothetical protein
MLALSVAATSAWASGAPFVETKPDTGLGETKVTLNGVVNPNGAETKYYFEYGTTKSYGTKTAETSVGSGTSNLEESKALVSLKAKTTYYYRIAATNVNGTTYGAEEVFYTTTAVLPEFKPVPVKKKFTSKSGEVTLETPAVNARITCSKSTSTGEITGTTTVGKLVVKFTGCSIIENGRGPCPVHSTGAKAEEVVTDALKGYLGNVATSEATSGAGLLLEAESGVELLVLAPIERSSACEEEIETAMDGNIAAEVATVGKKQLTNEFVFTHAVGKPSKIRTIAVKRGSVKVNTTFLFGVTEWAFDWNDETAFEEALEVT